MAFRRGDIRRYGRMVSRAAPYIAPALQLRSGLKLRGPGSRTMTKTKKGSDTGFTSRQHDMRTQYVKKRMPRGKRKRWVSFVKKVNAVSDNDRGVTTILFNKRGSISTPSTAGADNIPQQAVAETHLYGNSGVDQLSGINNMKIGLGDIGYIFTYDNNVAGASNFTKKMRFHSAVMDVSVRNPMDKIMELDCYEIGYHKSSTSLPELQGVLTSGTTTAATAATLPLLGATTININYRGVTPFELGPGISEGKIRILKKTKYFVGPGEVITRQLRDPRNRYFDELYQNRVNGFVIPGFTRSLLWIAKRQGVAIGTEQTQLEIGCTTTYKYTIEGQGRDRQLYVFG